MPHLIDLSWLGLLAITAGWSTFFSLFQKPHVRGWRNLGLLAGYGVGMAMFIALPWRQALATWALAGIVTGVLYVVYELVAYVRLADRTPDARPRLAPLMHGLLLWPVMFPEAAEQLLAELGVLKPASASPGA